MGAVLNGKEEKEEKSVEILDLKPHFLRLLKKLEKEHTLALLLSAEADELDQRKDSDSSKAINQRTSENHLLLGDRYARLYYLLFQSQKFKAHLKNPKSQQKLQEYLIQTQDFLEKRKEHRKNKNGLIDQFKKANKPEFFERLFAKRLLAPLMVTFLVSMVMMCYMTIVEVTAGGWFVLTLASVQALYYSFHEREDNMKKLGSIGAKIDDTLFHFSLKRLNMNQLYMLLAITFVLGINIGFAAAALTYAPPITLIAAWPWIYQCGILTGVGLFLSSVMFNVARDIYSVCTTQDKATKINSRNMISKLLVGTVSGLFIALVAIAEAAEQLGMLAALINIGATAQLFVASYGLWYFISRQMSSSYKVDHYCDKFQEVTLDSLYESRWQILEFVLLSCVIVGLTGLMLYPPAIIAPNVAKLGLAAMPEMQRFVVTFGVACITAFMLRPLTDGVSYMIWGDTPEPSSDSQSNEENNGLTVSSFIEPEPLAPAPLKALNNGIGKKLGFFVKKVEIKPVPETGPDFKYTESTVSACA